MFISHPPVFDTDLNIHTPVYWADIDSSAVKYYDKDGFELTPLEQKYYIASGVPLTNCLYNLACHKPWVEQTDFSTGVVLDHSMILQRYSFNGNALDQLKRYARQIPSLYKLIHTKHKWGIDFSIDFIEAGEVTDLFHIEIDSNNLDEILAVHQHATSVILNTDWVDGARAVRRRSTDWVNLDGHAQSDWKAQFFGFRASEQIRKVF